MQLWVFVFLASLSSLANGQKLSDFAAGTATDSLYGGSVGRGSREWSSLKPEIIVNLKPNAQLANLPENLHLNPNPEKGLTCKTAGATQGRLKYVNTDFSIVELNQAQCAPQFNAGDRNSRLVFVRNKDVANVYPKEDEKTDAGIRPLVKCTDCGPARAKTPSKIQDTDEDYDPHLLKLNDEIDRYIACYRPVSYSDWSDYNKYYKKLIEIAGHTFQVAYRPGQKESVQALLRPEDSQAAGPIPFLLGANPSVMKCLGLRESAWARLCHVKGDKTKTMWEVCQSSGAAMGIGQQTDGNVKNINALLHGRYEIIKGEIVFHPPHVWAQKLWKAYFENVKKAFGPEDSEAMKWLTTHPGTGKKCTEEMAIKARDAPCPINSIAAEGLYQVFIDLEMRKASPLYKDSETDDLNESERKDATLLQAVSHNAGSGTATRTVEASNNSRKWRKILIEKTKEERRPEISDYHQSIENCLGRGNWKPMTGSLQRDCSKVDP